MHKNESILFQPINIAKDIRRKDQSNRVDSKQHTGLGLGNKTKDIIVRTKDERSNIVLRFSNSSDISKVKTSKRSNEAESANDFIVKYISKLQREAKGVWSVLGRPFIARGDPDLSLVSKAQKAREARKLCNFLFVFVARIVYCTCTCACVEMVTLDQN